MLTIRILLALSVEKDFNIMHLDVKCAFLNGVLEKPVYMEIPKGLNISVKENICKLRKSLYGLKESPKCWYDKFNLELNKLNFTRSKCDSCLYYNTSEEIYLIIHVDDILCFSKK